jgi:hypothetical protein
LSKGTVTIVGSHGRKDVPSFEALYKAAKSIQTRKLELQEKRKQELEEKELEGVTFKPLLSSRQRFQEPEVRLDK